MKNKSVIWHFNLQLKLSCWGRSGVKGEDIFVKLKYPRRNLERNPWRQPKLLLLVPRTCLDLVCPTTSTCEWLLYSRLCSAMINTLPSEKEAGICAGWCVKSAGEHRAVNRCNQGAAADLPSTGAITWGSEWLRFLSSAGGEVRGAVNGERAS